VVGHEVDDVLEPGVADRVGEGDVRVVAAGFLADGVVVDDVVAVRRSGFGDVYAAPAPRRRRYGAMSRASFSVKPRWTWRR
jgi:hypothetical protein